MLAFGWFGVAKTATGSRRRDWMRQNLSWPYIRAVLARAAFD